MEPWFGLLAGIGLAALGGDLFEKGLVGLALRLRVPAGIIGATVAAFGTSSPELSVSVSAALVGIPQIALGDALGSNIVNLGLILGLVALLWTVASTGEQTRRDFGVALFAPGITLVLVADGRLSRFDGVILLVFFAAWLGSTLRHAKRVRGETEATGEEPGPRVVLSTVAGLAILIAASQLIVFGAKGIGLKLGFDQFVVGATVVAFGTSVPELTTLIVSRLRRHPEVGLGTLVGSNIFNGLLIVGTAACIRPIPVEGAPVAIALGVGILTVLLAFPRRFANVARVQGALLLAAYFSYLLSLLWMR